MSEPLFSFNIIKCVYCIYNFTIVHWSKQFVLYFQFIIPFEIIIIYGTLADYYYLLSCALSIWTYMYNVHCTFSLSLPLFCASLSCWYQACEKYIKLSSIKVRTARSLIISHFQFEFLQVVLGLRALHSGYDCRKSISQLWWLATQMLNWQILK